MGTELATAPKPGTSKLTGLQKAATLVVAVGEERASELFKHLGETEIEQLSLEIAKARKVPNETCREVISEAVTTVIAERYVAEGGVDYARGVLERSIGGERAAEIIGRLAATIERRPFEFLRRTPPEQIHVFLRNESPQTVALVVANLHTTLAAEVLSLLDADQQAEVARRVATMHETRPEIVAEVEAVVRSKLSTVIAQD
jgi:flagellar motor switch protein FliG